MCFVLHKYKLITKAHSLIDLVFSLLQVRTIKVTNVPLSATAENMKEFFSFSGEIEYVEMRRCDLDSLANSQVLNHAQFFPTPMCLFLL
jgi:hypothetical protein